MRSRTIRAARGARRADLQTQTQDAQIQVVPGPRQTHSKSYLEQAQQEIDAINQVVATVEKMELMSMLSRG